MATAVIELTGDETRLLRSMQKVIASEVEMAKKMRDVGNAGTDAANSTEKIATAGRRGQTEIDKLLRELRKTGPEGRKAANAMEDGFRAAGTHGRRSIDSVVESIKKIDPAAAKSANSARAEFDKVAKSGDNAFGAGMLARVVGLAGGIVSVGQAVNQITSFMREQEEVLDRSLEKQLTLAKAQQESAKNLAGFTAVERSQLLQEAVPQIARDTGFADAAQLTLALGTAASSGATPEQAISAVRAAAAVERLTPDNVGSTSAGAVSIMNRTGMEDARQAIALLQTTGTQAKIVDPASMIKEMPAAIGATLATLPNQDREEAARQAASLFANITQGGEDVRGASSATFQIDFSNRLGAFFDDLTNTQVQARSELQALEGKKTPLERDLVRMDELRSVIPQLEQMTDPQTLFGRIEALQQSPEVAKEFVGAGFGEQRFRGVMKDIFDPQSSISGRLKESFNIIQANTEFFDQEVRQQQSGTPQLALAFATGQAEAGRNAQSNFDIGGAGLASVRDITSSALEQTRLGGVRGFLDRFRETGVQSGVLSGGTAIEEGLAAIDALSNRRQNLAQDGITPSEQSKIATIDSAMQAISTIIQQQITAGVADPETLSSASQTARRTAGGLRNIVPQQFRGDESVIESRGRSAELLERIAIIMEAQLASTQATAENTSPANRPPANYNSGLQDNADATGRTSF